MTVCALLVLDKLGGPDSFPAYKGGRAQPSTVAKLNGLICPVGVIASAMRDRPLISSGASRGICLGLERPSAMRTMLSHGHHGAAAGGFLLIVGDYIRIYPTAVPQQRHGCRRRDDTFAEGQGDRLGLAVINYDMVSMLAHLILFWN